MDDNGIGRKRGAELSQIKNGHHRSFPSGANEKRLEILNQGKSLNVGVRIIDKLTDTGAPSRTRVEISIPIVPGHSGLELLDFFHPEDASFDIIFTTAYHHYAIQAFKLSAVDYLLKPIEPDDLESAIERFAKKVIAPIFPCSKPTFRPVYPENWPSQQ